MRKKEKTITHAVSISRNSKVSETTLRQFKTNSCVAITALKIPLRYTASLMKSLMNGSL